MRVAIVHDWLNGLRGGERCLQHFLSIYPDADIFTLLHVPGATSEEIDRRVYKTSFLNRLPGAQRFYRYLLPLYPAAVSRFDFSDYDLIVSLSHAAAKNVTVPRNVPHISYCFTPMRYIWDQAADYFGPLRKVLWPEILRLRRWDIRQSQGVTGLVGISKFVAARIRCYYRRESTVIYPPVSQSWIAPAEDGDKKGDYFLYAGALVPYKRPDRVIEAFNRMGEKLVVVGKGPEEARLRVLAKDHIHFAGHVSDSELAGFYRNCRALIFPGTEDFGMIPIECLAAGRPVIGSYSGALRESLSGLKPWDQSFNQACPTGVFVLNAAGSAEEKVAALVNSIQYFKEVERDILPSACVAQARKFAPGRFYRDWHSLCLQFKIDPGHSPRLHHEEERLIENA